MKAQSFSEDKLTASCVSYLKGIECSRIDTSSALTTAKLNTPLETVVRELRVKNILSTLVVDDNNVLLGMVDVDSLLRHFCANINNMLRDNTTIEEVLRPQQKVRPSFEALSPHDACSVALERLACADCSRCPLLTVDQKLVGLVTRTDLLALLTTAMRAGGPCYALGRRTLAELNTVARSSEFGTIATSASVSTAILSLARWHVPALAVIDEQRGGALVGNFSTTDLLDIWLDRDSICATLLLSVEAYLTVHSPTSLLPLAVSVRLDETLADVVGCLVENRVHRLWVVDDDDKPMSVLSMCDICRVITATH